MFKGLKSKIAEETKKLHNVVVSQVGEGLSSLHKLGDASGNLISTTEDGSAILPSSNHMYETTDSTVYSSIDNLASWSNSHSGSMLIDLPHENLIGPGDIGMLPLMRQSSCSSLNSTDNYFPTLSPLSKMDQILSDTETDVESVVGSSYSASIASKEQISGVLSKLQGRAANYKDKYRKLAHAYRSLHSENEKVRVILTASQDKALKRIHELREERKLADKSKRELEDHLRTKILLQDSDVATLKTQILKMLDGKLPDADILADLDILVLNDKISQQMENTEKIKKLEELLTRCKDTIKGYKEKVLHLTGENDKLMLQHHEASKINDVEANSDYEHKLNMSREEFERKLREESERTALSLAQFKQEMHHEIDRKEATIDELRRIINDSEKKENEWMSKYHEELKSRKALDAAMEKEKRDLALELSQAKQAALKIVKEEEEAKRAKMEQDFSDAFQRQASEFDLALDSLRLSNVESIRLKEQELARILREREEQTQLALEERDLQKMAALAQHDERNDLLQSQLESLKTENLQLVSKLSQLEEKHDGLGAEQGRRLALLEQQLAASQLQAGLESQGAKEAEARLNAELERLRDELRGLRAEKMQLERLVASSDEQRAAALRETLASCEALTEELQAVKLVERGLLDKCSSLERDLGRCSEQRTELVDQVASLSSSSQGMAAELAALHEQLQSCDKELAAANAKVVALAADSAEGLTRLNGELSGAKDRVESLARDNARLEEALEAGRVEQAKLEVDARVQQQLHEQQTVGLEAALREKQDSLASAKKKYESVLKDLRWEISAKADETADREAPRALLAERDRLQVEPAGRQLEEARAGCREAEEAGVARRKLEKALRAAQAENRRLGEQLRQTDPARPSEPAEKLQSVSLLDSCPNVVFAEPTEAEYLRNIVFRYLVERESLGRESVKLAKAIAAVLKLTVDQTREVIEKEESRALHWFPSLH